MKEWANTKEERMDHLSKAAKLNELYSTDSRIKDFILKFFKVRKGVRCVAFQYAPDKIFWRYRNPTTKGLGTLDNNNFQRRMDLATDAGVATFFYEYIFDEIVLMYPTKNFIYETDSKGQYILEDNGRTRVRILHNDRIIGSSITIDVDAPRNKLGYRINMLDRKYYEDFMYVKYRIEKALDNLGVKYNIVFSGNGIYFILKSIFLDEDEYTLQEFQETKWNLLVDIQPLTTSKNCPRPMIDLGDISWASYHKIPWTFHESRPRLTIPLSPGYIDWKWLNTVTDIGYVTDQNIINEILKQAEWKWIY